jgi:dUTPase
MQSVLVKKETRLLKNFPACEINIEISTTAKSLEKEYSTSWEFNRDTSLDSFFDLRACIIKPLVIKPGQIAPIPTGIYPQLKNPNFRIVCSSHTDVVFEQGLALADGISTFEYSFRNEIWLLIENKFQQAQTVQPAQKIATFSVNYLPRMVINYVDEIEEIEWKNKSAKSYIQKIKKKLLPDIYDTKKQPVEDVFYTREDVNGFLDKGKVIDYKYKDRND